MENPSLLECVATVLLGLAILHTFAVNYFQRWGNQYPEGSVAENLFHLLGEVEITFGLWAGVLVVFMLIFFGKEETIAYVDSRAFTEPLFVFAVMTVCATKPILGLSETLIQGLSRFIPLQRSAAFYFSILFLGPLLGSFITEPAAMTICALLLKDIFLRETRSFRFLYITIAVLFVNVSIGGVLTPYAAPPVLMVASKWNWDFSFMIQHFGWQAMVAVFINSFLATFLLSDELKKIRMAQRQEASSPWALKILHLIFLTAIVVMAHHPALFMGFFLFFLGVVAVTREYQTELRLRESLLVAFFLAGLVVLGGLQEWWLRPIINGLDSFPLAITTTVLTAFTDNAALTYLGSQVEGLSEISKHSLVLGAVAGGGLTVMANAPNPAGFSILQGSFGRDGINPVLLFLYGLIPTAIAFSALWLLQIR